jgi:hypothetical protein
MVSALRPWWRVLGGLSLLLIAAALTVWRVQLPAVAAPSAEGFSGARAMETLRELLPNDRPHPRGSTEHHAVVDRLVRILSESGLSPEVHDEQACSPLGPCGDVKNVSVHLPGKRGDIVLVSAHTDSVPTGPGAGDDGQGVAILVELGRYLKDHDHENSITLLFTDGEEDGLLGAIAFLEQDPSAARVGVNINLEARGQTGLSTLFRTAGEDAWLIDIYAKHAPSPFTSSVHQVVFETMPHYTDLSVWQSFGIPGVDFAFIDGSEAYHQPEDTVDNLDPRSVQSQGDNALAMLKGLMNADLAHPPRGHANWFDVMGLFTVRWPRTWTFWVSLFALSMTVTSFFWMRRRHGLTVRDTVLGTLAVLLCWVGCGGIGLLLSWVPGALHHWPLAGLPLIAVALWSASLGLFSRRISALGLQWGAALLTSVIAVPIALFWPGMAHLWGVPVLAALVGGLFDARGSSSPGVTSTYLALSASAIVWFPLLEGVRIALGPDALVPLSIGLGMTFMWMGPLMRKGEL